MSISTKSKWISTSGWRGYEQPINAVAGANDTGSAEDSPCPTSVMEKELEGFKKILRENKIKYREFTGKTSNVFCMHVYILVAPEDREKALMLAKEYTPGTTLFYDCDD